MAFYALPLISYSITNLGTWLHLETEEERMLRQALEFSMQPVDEGSAGMFDPSQDLSSMTEEEQLDYALRLSQQTSSGL